MNNFRTKYYPNLPALCVGLDDTATHGGVSKRNKAYEVSALFLQSTPTPFLATEFSQRPENFISLAFCSANLQSERIRIGVLGGKLLSGRR